MFSFMNISGVALMTCSIIYYFPIKYTVIAFLVESQHNLSTLINVNAQDRWHQTPLQEAISHDHVEVADFPQPSAL